MEMMSEEKKFTKYEELGAYHWEAYYTDTNYTQLVNFFLQRFDFNDKVVYDFGCGDGVVSYLIAQKAAKVFGIDLNETAIKLAQSKTKNADNLSFELKNVYETVNDFPKIKGDIVISIDVIEHLAQPRVLVKGICNYLRSNGLAIVGTPIAKPDHLWDPRFHFTEYYPQQIDEIMSDSFQKDQAYITKYGTADYYFYAGRKK
jgi:2-polyprenyl-3-methyl-5-hydroxy-6-metoxy-1,4-benzoquinol methylase